jgi:hypothetical protein
MVRADMRRKDAVFVVWLFHTGEFAGSCIAHEDKNIKIKMLIRDTIIAGSSREVQALSQSF